MTDKSEETVHDIKTPGVNNPETHVLTDNWINTCLVLFFSDLNKTQICKMPCRDSPHHEIEVFMKIMYLNFFKPNEDTDDYHITKPNDENFLFEFWDEKIIYVGEKVNRFETIDIIVKCSLDLGFNDIKFPHAYNEGNIYFMLHQKKFLFKNMKLQQKKTSITLCIKKMMNWKVKKLQMKPRVILNMIMIL